MNILEQNNIKVKHLSLLSLLSTNNLAENPIFGIIETLLATFCPFFMASASDCLLLLRPCKRIFTRRWIMSLKNYAIKGLQCQRTGCLDDMRNVLRQSSWDIEFASVIACAPCPQWIWTIFSISIIFSSVSTHFKTATAESVDWYFSRNVCAIISYRL